MYVRLAQHIVYRQKKILECYFRYVKPIGDLFIVSYTLSQNKTDKPSDNKSLAIHISVNLLRCHNILGMLVFSEPPFTVI